MKKKKIKSALGKLPYLCVVLFILISLLTFTVSADGGNLGDGDYEILDESYTYYEPGMRDHGLPWTLYFTGYASASAISIESNRAYTFALSDFGVTYPATNSSNGVSTDQYPRADLISKDIRNYPRYNPPFMYSWYKYASFGSSPSYWWDDHVSYSYASYAIGYNLSYSLSYRYADKLTALNDAIDASYEDESLLSAETYTFNSVTFSLDGNYHTETMFSETNGWKEFSSGLMGVYVLRPLNHDLDKIVFSMQVQGYNVVDGNMVSLTREFNNNDTSLDSYFEFDYIESDYNSSVNYVTYQDIAYFYDGAYGLETYDLWFDYFSFMEDNIVGEIEYITDIDFVIGYDYITTNSIINDYQETYCGAPCFGAYIQYDDVIPYTERTLSRRTSSFLAQESGVDESTSLLGWLGTSVASVFDVPLFGFFSLGDVLYVVIGLGVLIAFLKVFAGG